MKTINYIFFLIITLSFLGSCDSKQNSRNVDSQTDSSTVTEKVIPGKYCNEKYSYCISFPEADFTPDNTKDREDGTIILSNDSLATIDVHVGNRDATIKGGIDRLKEAYDTDRVSKGKREITSQTFTSTSYDVIGYENRTLFYQKTIISNGQIITAVFSYDNDAKDKYYPMIMPIFKSFK